MKLNWGAERHHYSMFNVGRSMFDVHLLKTLYGVNVTCECLKNKLALMGLNPNLSRASESNDKVVRLGCWNHAACQEDSRKKHRGSNKFLIKVAEDRRWVLLFQYSITPTLHKYVEQSRVMESPLPGAYLWAWILYFLSAFRYSTTVITFLSIRRR